MRGHPHILNEALPAPVGRALLARARAVAEAFFSTEEGPPPEARLDWLELQLADFLARSGLFARLVLGASLFAIAIFAPLSIRRITKLSALSIADRQRALERIERSPLAIALLASKAILCILYFEHPDAAREIGADGRCLRSAP